MFYEFLYPLRYSFQIFNLLGYITFRSAMAAITALFIGIIAGPFAIKLLRRLKIGQQIRGEGIPDLYDRHKNKAGTPTMGGLLIIGAILISVLLWGNLHSRLLGLALWVMLALTSIGFIDDYMKLKQKIYKGLSKKYKLIAQLAIGIILGLYLTVDPLHNTFGTSLSFPFLKNFLPELGFFFALFVALVITASSNAVNLTDGLDGLAIGCVIISALAFSVLSYIVGRSDYCAYLHIIHIPGSAELTIFCSAIVGAGMGFLWYNAHPAEIFMGDTGSLALGGALGTIAVLLKQEFLLVLIGGIFVVEALSVILQVASYRLTGKRIFRMAPLHHHFEMKGMAESKIIARFWIVASILCLFGLATLKIR